MTEYKIPLEVFDDPTIKAARVCTIIIGGEEMNELIEINEDNCVLDENELSIIDKSLEESLNYAAKEMMEPIRRSLKNCTTKIFLKINKLNDLAKGLKDKKLVVVSQEFIDDIAEEKKC